MKKNHINMNISHLIKKENSNKPKILFVTQTLGYKSACGIGLIGDLFGNALLDHPKYNVKLLYSDDLAEIKKTIRNYLPDAILYNYSPVSTYWINDISLRYGEFEHIPQARIMHDINQHDVDIYDPKNNYGWYFNFTSDHTLKGNKYIYPATRIIPPSPNIIPKSPDIITIGFHGFGFKQKGIHRIAEQVVKEFDEAIIKLHIPYAFYGDFHGSEANKRLEEVKNIVSVNPNIKVIASHKMLSTMETINLLSENTINCYFYDYNDGVALSSSVDYALSARKPIAVTKSHQMRNLWNLTPSILIENSSLKEIISNDIEPLKPLYQKYSKEEFHNDYDIGLQILLNYKK